MNSSFEPPVSRAEEQASLWATRLDGGKLPPSHRAELAAWLEEAPEHRSLLSVYCQLSADLEARLAGTSRSLPPAPSSDRAESRSRRAWLPRVFWTGTVLAAAAALAVMFRPALDDPAPQSIATAAGHRTELTLADGSEIQLNANTSLVIEQTRTERRVQLRRGQAFFAVASTENRPFIVETPAGSIRVTGTRFDVRAAEDAPLEVTVVEGSVLVSPRAGSAGASLTSIALTAGGRFTRTADGGSVRELSAHELAESLAWREGRVVFSNTPLAEAAAHFSRFHGRNLQVHPEVTDLRIIGRFSLDDLDGFLATLNDGESFKVSIMRDGSGNIRIEPRRAR